MRADSWKSLGVIAGLFFVSISAQGGAKENLVAKSPVGSAKMVRVPKGALTHSAPTTCTDCDNRPESKVVPIKSFAVDETEVTVAAYSACVLEQKCKPAQTGGFCNAGKADRSEHPINCVTYSQAEEYCRYQGKRLPTNDEWTYVAYALFASIGSDFQAYPWGTTSPEQEAGVCWRRQSGTCAAKQGPQTLLGERVQSGGVYGLAGNVWEWTQTEPDPDESKLTFKLAKGRYCDRWSSCIIRGGAWNNNDSDSMNNRGSARGLGASSSGPEFSSIGFRCVKD